MPDFVHELRVRYGECDPQGIVFNPNYLAYFDHTVSELWRASALGSWDAMVERGVDVVVGEANIRFRAPARFDDVIAIHAGIAKLGTTSADARARDPPRRRAADRGLAAAGLRRREDLAEDARSRTGCARRSASTRRRLSAASARAGDEAQRVDRGAPSRSRHLDRGPALAGGPPAASSACQRATWRSISSG